MSDVKGKICHLVVLEPVRGTLTMWPILAFCITLPGGTAKFEEFHRQLISFQLASGNDIIHLVVPEPGPLSSTTKM